MGATVPVSDVDAHDALVASLVELEHHVEEAGWEQPPRLFALVPTDALVAAEPALARTLGLRTTADGAPPGALTAVEQDDFAARADLVADLAALEWPETVFGCAVATVRTFLPASAEVELPPTRPRRRPWWPRTPSGRRSASWSRRPPRPPARGCQAAVTTR